MLRCSFFVVTSGKPSLDQSASVAENTQRSRARAVPLFETLLVHAFHQVVVLAHLP